MKNQNSTLQTATWLLIAALTLLAAPQAMAQDPDKAFEAMLQAVDTVPARADLDAAWADAPRRLMAASADVNRDPWTRSRAMSLLSGYPTPETRAFLITLTQDPAPRIRQVAVYTLSRSFGASGDAELVARVAAKISDEDDKVRRYAIRALRWIDHPSAGAALEAIVKGDDAELAHLARYVLKKRTARMAK